MSKPDEENQDEHDVNIGLDESDETDAIPIEDLGKGSESESEEEEEGEPATSERGSLQKGQARTRLFYCGRESATANRIATWRSFRHSPRPPRAVP
jgi:hypothetical protein